MKSQLATFTTWLMVWKREIQEKSRKSRKNGENFDFDQI